MRSRRSPRATALPISVCSARSRAVDSIEASETYVAGGRDMLLRERLVQDAVIRNFEIIGESASRLFPKVRGRPGLGWGEVSACRNRLIHGYWIVDLGLGRDVVARFA